ncbi:MAG: hypothetical protein NTW87_04465 [Planctomycetota bacterium]|nr:hypothetical protein [Planctomycetota bacterium]
MKTLPNKAAQLLAVLFLFLSLPVSVHAWEPNGEKLDKAIGTGDFGGYLANITAWLNQKTPAAPGGISQAAMQGLLKDPVFVNTLDQRKLIFHCGADKVGAFAKADPANRAFLAWFLKNTQAMDLYLEGCGKATGEPCIASLSLWKTILNADPDSKEGIYLKLAIATSLAHAKPLTSFGYEDAIDPVKRYQHFKAAHKNKELVPGFDDLTVWEYAKVVDSVASDKDLTWAREMLNTWRPDLRRDNRVVRIVSEVWRRTSPIPYTSFPTLMEGGGKCLGRARFGGLICTAFGIPAIGIGQPAHAAFACKALDTWTLEYGVGG